MPSFKKLDIKGVIGIEQLVREHVEEIEPGLRIIDSRTLFGNATIDLVGLDSKESLVLIALGASADEAMLLRLLEAGSWCLANPEILHRLYPMAPSRPGWSPRVFCVAERVSEAFIRTVKQCAFSKIDCVRLLYLELDGSKGVYFEPLERRQDRPVEPPENSTDRPAFSEVIKVAPPIEPPAKLPDGRAERLDPTPRDGLTLGREPTVKGVGGATSTPSPAPQATAARSPATARDTPERESKRSHLFATVVNLPELTGERHTRDDASSTTVDIIDASSRISEVKPKENGGRSHLFAEAVKRSAPRRGEGTALDLLTPFDAEPRSPVLEKAPQGGNARGYLFAGAVALPQVSEPTRVAPSTPSLDVIDTPAENTIQAPPREKSPRNDLFAESIKLPVPEVPPVTPLAGRLAEFREGWQEALARECETELPRGDAKEPITDPTGVVPAVSEPPRTSPNARRFAELKDGWQEALARLCEAEPPREEIKATAAEPPRVNPVTSEPPRVDPNTGRFAELQKGRPEPIPSRHQAGPARTDERKIPANPATRPVRETSPTMRSGARSTERGEDEIQPVVELEIGDDADAAAQTTRDLATPRPKKNETPAFPKWANPHAARALNPQTGKTETRTISPEPAEPPSDEEIKKYREKWKDLLNELGGLHLPEGTVLSRQWRDFLDSLEAKNLERRKKIPIVKPLRETGNTGKGTVKGNPTTPSS